MRPPPAGRTIVTLAAALLLSAGSAAGQPAATTPTVSLDGVRIRVELAPADSSWLSRRRRQTLVGTVVRADGASILLSLRAGQSPVQLPTAAVHAVYRSNGPRPRAVAGARGALRSGTIGAISGLVRAAVAPRRGESAGRIVLTRAAGGAIFGAVLALIVPGERWERLASLRH